MCLTLTWIFGIRQRQMYISQTKVSVLFAIWLQLEMYVMSHHFQRYALSRCAWPWYWPLEWVKIESKYDIWKAIYDLQFDGNNNFYQIYHHFQNIRTVKCARPWHWSLKDVKSSTAEMRIESAYMTCYLMVIDMVKNTITTTIK